MNEDFASLNDHFNRLEDYAQNISTIMEKLQSVVSDAGDRVGSLAASTKELVEGIDTNINSLYQSIAEMNRTIEQTRQKTSENASFSGRVQGQL